MSSTSRRRSERGSAFIEMAITLPLLIMIFLGAVDFGRAFYTGMELSNAARAGAQYGSTNLANTTPSSQIESVAVASVNITGVTAVASPPACNCYDDAGLFVAAISCATPVATACAGSHRVITITVTTSANFTSGIPGIPTMPLSRTATMRVSE